MSNYRRRIRLDVLAIIGNSELEERVSQVCFLYNLNKLIVPNWQSYIEQTGFFNRPFAVLTDRAEEVPNLVTAFPRGYVLYVGNSQEVSSAKVTLERALRTSVLDYFCFFHAKGSYFSLPKGDLYPSTLIPFNSFQYLSLNQRYLPVVFRGFVLTEEKYAQLHDGQSLYVRFFEAPALHRYVCQYNDKMGTGLKRRLRSIVTLMSAEVSALYEKMCSDSNGEVVLKIYKDFEREALEYSEYCREDVDLFAVVKASALEEFNMFFSTPWLVVATGALAAKMEGIDQEIVMKAALFSQVGFLDLPPLTLKDTIEKGLDRASNIDQEQYANLLTKSLELIQSLQPEHESRLGDIVKGVWAHRIGSSTSLGGQSFEVTGESRLIVFVQKLYRRVWEMQESGNTAELRYLARQVIEEARLMGDYFPEEFLKEVEALIQN